MLTLPAFLTSDFLQGRTCTKHSSRLEPSALFKVVLLRKIPRRGRQIKTKLKNTELILNEGGVCASAWYHLHQKKKKSSQTQPDKEFWNLYMQFQS